jgi:hypothetical protein
MRVTQAKLVKTGVPHTEYMVCWLSSEDIKLKEGMLISLKGMDEDVWRILYLYSTQEQDEINRKWPVGGL